VRHIEQDVCRYLGRGIEADERSATADSRMKPTENRRAPASVGAVHLADVRQDVTQKAQASAEREHLRSRTLTLLATNKLGG
jgi:hypothetical protein